MAPHRPHSLRKYHHPTTPPYPESPTNPSQATPSPTPSPDPRKPNPGGTWFSQFHSFTYDPTAGLKSNFERLANTRNWKPKLRSKRWTQCQAAEFDAAYGKDTSKLESWQALCREVLIAEVPGSITQCKTVCSLPFPPPFQVLTLSDSYSGLTNVLCTGSRKQEGTGQLGESD